MNEKNQNLTKLPVKDFAKKIICDGHLFLKIGNRNFYLMKPGVLVDSAFIKKHAITNSIFDYECVVSYQVKEKFKTYFKELRYLQIEKDLRNKCAEIVRYFNEVYSTDTHFLSFALACYEEFCVLPFDQQTKMHETDTYLFRKSFYSAAFSLVVAMTNDFYHYLMLKDFFNITFVLDYGLCEKDYSYYVSEACNHENQKPGYGKNYLEYNKASADEKKVFFGHPEKSYRHIKTEKLLNFPELAESILYQHELSDGTGFPRGVLKGQVSSWEAVVVLSDSLVEIVSDYTFEKDVVNYLKQFKNIKLKDLPVSRVYKKLCLGLEMFNQLKEVGS